MKAHISNFVGLWVFASNPRPSMHALDAKPLTRHCQGTISVGSVTVLPWNRNNHPKGSVLS